MRSVIDMDDDCVCNCPNCGSPSKGVFVDGCLVDVHPCSKCSKGDYAVRVADLQSRYEKDSIAGMWGAD